MEREGEEVARREVDPNTGTLEKTDKEKRASGLGQNPEDWREQK